MSQNLELRNISPLEVKFHLKTTPPFNVTPDSFHLQPMEKCSARVEFDPGFRTDRQCTTIRYAAAV
jgi:hypothetical protein